MAYTLVAWVPGGDSVRLFLEHSPGGVTKDEDLDGIATGCGLFRCPDGTITAGPFVPPSCEAARLRVAAVPTRVATALVAHARKQAGKGYASRSAVAMAVTLPNGEVIQGMVMVSATGWLELGALSPQDRQDGRLGPGWSHYAQGRILALV